MWCVLGACWARAGRSSDEAGQALPLGTHARMAGAVSGHSRVRELSREGRSASVGASGSRGVGAGLSPRAGSWGSSERRLRGPHCGGPEPLGQGTCRRWSWARGVTRPGLAPL